VAPRLRVYGLISAVYEALNGLGAPAPKAEPEKPKGAVSARASIKPDFLVSMIDGKPYKMLRRHLGPWLHARELSRGIWPAAQLSDDGFELCGDAPCLGAQDRAWP